MKIEILTAATLEKMRRGAEHLCRKYKERLPDALITIRHDVAKELGLEVADCKPKPIKVAGTESVGIFDDEPPEETVLPDAMSRVKLVDYVSALQSYGKADKAETSTKPEKEPEPDAA
jgi:hypothetical protein